MIHAPEYSLKENVLLRKIVERTAFFTGDDFFKVLVKNLAETLNVYGAWVTEYDEENKRLRAKAFWLGDDWVDQYEYDIRGTPCEPVISRRALVHIPDRVIELFPEDPDLPAMNAVGYMGIPLKGAGRRILGHLAVLDTKPMMNLSRLEAIFRIFAARATAEMQRPRAAEPALENNLQLRHSVKEARIEPEPEKNAGTPYHFDDIIGESPKIKEALGKVRQVAETDVSVLILGETGTGKELFARAAHKLSLRRERPMIKLNCAALPATLIESELFGHEKGAFTGAASRREGRFQLADGGTIFLDEIGELPLGLQAKLLRVLQEGEFEPVGSSKTIKTDVRVIAATHRNLPEEIKKGEFREDLYYRLNVFPILIPALRERGQDIVLIASAIAQNCARKMGKSIEVFSEKEARKLLSYSWPGNVRELQNVIERAVIMAPDSGSLCLDWEALEARSGGGPEGLQAQSRIYTQQELGQLERENIIRALNLSDWKVSGKNGAAELLQMPPSTLSSRMKALNISRHIKGEFS